MTKGSDFKIVDEDIQRLTQDLKTIARAFVDDTHAASDVSGAFGHQRLAEEFSSFSESWRVNRERMLKNIDELAAAMGNIKVATDEVDRGLGGSDGTRSGPSAQGPKPSETGGDQAQTSAAGSPAGGLSAGSAASSSSGTLPATSAGAAAPVAEPPATPNASPVEPATTSPTGDETTVRVGQDGDFYAAVTVGGAGAAAATATLMALYKLWDAHRGQVTGNAMPTPEAEQADARSRLLAGLKELGADGGDVSVELVSEGQSPDHVMAILRGEDGSVEVLDLSPEDAPAAAAEDRTGSGDVATGDGATDPTEDGATPPSDSSGSAADSSNEAGGVTGAPTEGGDSLPKVSSSTDASGGGQAAEASAGAGETLSAVPASGSTGSPQGAAAGWSAGHADAAGGLPTVATAAEATLDDDSTQSVHSPQVAGATAGMGMAGVGAVSAAGMGHGGSAAPAKNQSDTLRKVTETPADEPAKETQR